MDEKTFSYFAYGSNMLKSRLIDRAPFAVKSGTGYLSGRRLTFDKVSQDGSGKCDAEKTDVESDRVYGVIFKINCEDKKKLDKAEGLGYGYKEEFLDVITNDGPVKALTYIATKKEKILKPYRWYKVLTIAGAVENGLPNYYIEWIRSVEATEDPDNQRRKEHEKLLFAN